MTEKMKALVYEGPRMMTIREVEIPAPGDDELLIRVEKAGICGSELSGYTGHNSLRKPPLIMGHEFSGIIEESGSRVTRLLKGDRVTVNPLISCGVCHDCRTGAAQLCQTRKLLGAHIPGAFAEFIVVPAASTYKLDDHISLEEGTFVEPFACAVHVCRLLQLTTTDRLVIYGAGPIGLFTLQAAQVYGLRDIVIVDLNTSRLEIAQELGGIAVTGLDKLEDSVKGCNFDAAVDAVGMEVTRSKCIEVVRPGGRVIFTGLHEADSKLPINHVIRNEVQMTGAFAYSPHDFEVALQWIGEGRVNLMPWTLTAPLEEGSACFEKLISGPGKVAKIILNLR
ncbi:galactitol-1-phosphate 5-dehydrogenase [Paenibacillus sp. HWE-109]|uniref:zinc-dependent alcohol dehydrogenase n=1 Tax=Paenibacillus sp. HWE-109 TaxID=1306526 RepID=UPI001EDD98DC|nr:galactitol-1-phosphate 5-dehydrogenase [Paenibacillus sp. HWE-109]UKS28044.1 galactitol-1-phosphate 5-dehydrogenase [Paenibacillus sp. HWE-109]